MTEPALAPGPPMMPPLTRKRWRLLGITLVAGLWKLKGVLSLLKAGAVAFKFSKFGGTAISMAVTLGVYAWLLGWRFAAGFIALLFVHEMGHAAMLKARGIAAGAPVFIPMVGASITMRGQPRDVKVEAEVALAGPIAGSVAAMLCWALFALTGSLLWGALAHTGFLLNLFNLLPVSPLDGGRVAGAISKWLWGLGAILLVAGIWLWQAPMLILVLILAGVQLWREVRRPADETRAYYRIARGDRWRLGLAYFGLVAWLGYAGMASHRALQDLPVPAATASAGTLR